MPTYTLIICSDWQTSHIYTFFLQLPLALGWPAETRYKSSTSRAYMQWTLMVLMIWVDGCVLSICFDANIYLNYLLRLTNSHGNITRPEHNSQLDGCVLCICFDANIYLNYLLQLTNILLVTFLCCVKLKPNLNLANQALSQGLKTDGQGGESECGTRSWF